jgi:hypothetical protein
MLEDPDRLRGFVDSGASFMDVVQYLSEAVSPLRPIDFLRIFQEDLGISFVRARDVLEYFDPDMRPIADESLINSLGREILMLRPKSRLFTVGFRMRGGSRRVLIHKFPYLSDAS